MESALYNETALSLPRQPFETYSRRILQRAEFFKTASTDSYIIRSDVLQQTASLIGDI
jgi:hypothetical protein